MDMNEVSSHKKLIVRLVAEILAQTNLDKASLVRLCADDLLKLTNDRYAVECKSADTFEKALNRELFERD